MTEPPRFVTLDDYEPAARAALSDDFYGFVAGAAGDEWSHRENRRAFDRWVLRPRVLRGVGAADPRVELFDAALSLPVLVAPWAYQRSAHPDGELATARAAARAGTVMCVSTTASEILEEIAAASDGPKWWQLYVFTDRGYTEDVLARVVAAGFGAVVWTVDLNAYGLRHRATLDALPEVVDAVAGRVPVLMDGGVRRGTDVVKALALGAAAVLLGRPAAWGLAAAGEDGVVDILRILREEVENAMTLCGCATVADVTRDHVARATA